MLNMMLNIYLSNIQNAQYFMALFFSAQYRTVCIIQSVTHRNSALHIWFIILELYGGEVAVMAAYLHLSSLRAHPQLVHHVSSGQ